VTLETGSPFRSASSRRTPWSRRSNAPARRRGTRGRGGPVRARNGQPPPQDVSGAVRGKRRPVRRNPGEGFPDLFMMDALGVGPDEAIPLFALASDLLGSGYYTERPRVWDGSRRSTPSSGRRRRTGGRKDDAGGPETSCASAPTNSPSDDIPFAWRSTRRSRSASGSAPRSPARSSTDPRPDRRHRAEEDDAEGRVKYKPQEIERNGSAGGRGRRLPCPDALSAPKYYCLEMFPYPSGRIHMGHVRCTRSATCSRASSGCRGSRCFTDRLGRVRTARRKRGAPHGTHPRSGRGEHRVHAEQLKEMGISYDWTASSPPVPRNITGGAALLPLDAAGRLAYRKRATLNWCGECQTSWQRAGEPDGRASSRPHAVTQKELDQWFIGITKYAEELLSGHKELEGGGRRTSSRCSATGSAAARGGDPLPARRGAATSRLSRRATRSSRHFMSMAPSTDGDGVREAGRQGAEVREFVDRVTRQDRIARTSETS